MSVIFPSVVTVPMTLRLRHPSCTYWAEAEEIERIGVKGVSILARAPDLLEVLGQDCRS